jgi:hypothetical protein
MKRSFEDKCVPKLEFGNEGNGPQGRGDTETIRQAVRPSYKMGARDNCRATAPVA